MYTYLLVDDEALTRKGTIKKLESLKDRITCIGEAENGQEAMEKIQQLNPDVIITDMNMPIMDGTQLLTFLTEHYPQKQIIVISSYKDFEYMHQAIKANAIDYILKPFGKEEIQSCVLRAMEQIENNSSMQQQLISSQSQKEVAQYEYDMQLLKNMLLGYHTSSSTLVSEKLSFINETHHFILITLHSLAHLNEVDLQNFLIENEFGDLAVYLQNENTPYLGSIILFVSESALLSVPDFCKQIAQSLIYRYESELPTLVAGISQIHRDISELHDAFLETVSALNSKGINDNFRYYFYSDTPTESSGIDWTEREAFLFYLESGMSSQIATLLDKLNQYLSTLPTTLSDIKYYYVQLSYQAQSIMAQYVEQVKSSSSSLSMQNTLNTMFTLEELQKYYLQFFSNISEIMKNCSVYATNDAVEKVKIYVQKNYKNDLSMEFISSLLYLNRSYLSHLFKEKTGEKFVDYLNNVRIEKSKELLKSTDKKMYAIAKAVGYDNIKYFFRIFKKKTGLTPEQYRNQEITY